jgi:PAS domain S-box-containing protein
VLSSLPQVAKHSATGKLLAGGAADMAQKSRGQKSAERVIVTQLAELGPFVAAVEATRMPMLITDARLPDHPIVYANASFLQLTGYELDEVLGQTHRFLNGPDTNPEAVDPLDLFREERDIEVETVLYRKDGRSFIAAMFLRPIFDERGVLIQHFASYLDITRLREVERQLRESNQLLEKRVTERTELLERALHEREVLMREVNHRAKNSIQLAAAMLNVQARLQEGIDPAETLKNAADRLVGFARIHDVLHQAGAISDIHANAYLHQLCEALAETSPQIVLKIVADDFRLNLDRVVPIGLIVNELMTNALKHAFPDQRHGTIEVALTRTGSNATLTVSDDGVGFANEMIEKPSLGVRLARSFAQRLGGELNIVSDQGTSVSVEFPLDDR